MTVPRDPAANDPQEELRRGRHAAPEKGADAGVPGDAESASVNPAAGPVESHDSAFAGGLDPDDPLLVNRPSFPDPTTRFTPTAAEAGGRADADADFGASPRRRHAAEGSSFRLPGWMIAVAGLVVAGLIAWLVIGMSGDDEDSPDPAASSSGAASTSAGPTPVDAASLPQLLCVGSSYVVVETGQPTEQLLADPKGIEAQYPGSQLSTIPPGCLTDTAQRDQVVLAMGPYTSIEEACASAKTLQGVGYTPYAGSAEAGLTPTSCP